MRNQHYFILMVTILFLLATGVGTALCGDLDDGMPIDDHISSYDDLGNPEQNINFIKLNAKSNAKRLQKSIDKGVKDKDSGGSGSGAMNSVVMGAGSNVKGDIIIIDESKGDKTQVVE